MRLVMPPGASIPLALLFFGLFWLIFGTPTAYPLFAGFLVGYLVYDYMHYYLHHFVPRVEAGQAACANSTCATTSRTTVTATASPRRSGMWSSAPCRARVAADHRASAARVHTVTVCDETVCQHALTVK